MLTPPCRSPQTHLQTRKMAQSPRLGRGAHGLWCPCLNPGAQMSPLFEVKTVWLKLNSCDTSGPWGVGAAWSGLVQVFMGVRSPVGWGGQGRGTAELRAAALRPGQTSRAAPASVPAPGASRRGQLLPPDGSPGRRLGPDSHVHGKGQRSRVPPSSLRALSSLLPLLCVGARPTQQHV